jgi:hypothetical protein
MYKNLNVEEIIKTSTKVNFVYYRDNNLYYKTSNGFEFPVSIEDAGTATFLAEDKPILFMRWIRKHVENIKTGREDGYNSAN